MQPNVNAIFDFFRDYRSSTNIFLLKLNNILSFMFKNVTIVTLM